MIKMLQTATENPISLPVHIDDFQILEKAHVMIKERTDHGHPSDMLTVRNWFHMFNRCSDTLPRVGTHLHYVD